MTHTTTPAWQTARTIRDLNNQANQAAHINDVEAYCKASQARRALRRTVRNDARRPR